MIPGTRKKLVRQWKRFSQAHEDFHAGDDDAVSGMNVNDVISSTPGFVRLTTSRATYLKGLVEAGLISGYEGCPDDDRLWEINPINLDTPEGVADLWEA